MLKGFSRVLKYSFYMGTKYTLISLAASVVFDIYMTIINSEEISLNNLIDNFGYYFIFFAVMSMVINEMVSSVTTVSELISMGCIRIHAALSITMTEFINMIEVFAITLIYIVVMPTIDAADMMNFIFVAFMLTLGASGITALFCTLIMRFGRIAYLALVFILCFAVGSVGGFIAASSGNLILSITAIIAAISVISVIVFVIGNIILMWYSKYIEVKA